MDTRYGVVEKLADFKDADGGFVTRARLMGEDPVWWYPIYGPLPEIGDTVKVLVLKGETPYIDTTARVL